MHAVKLTRFPDWPERLAAFLASRHDMPFAWGSNDCAIFAADCILALTGEDAAKAWRGYKSALGARRRIQKAGGMSGFAAGLEAVPILRANRGDIVLATCEGLEMFGVLPGNGQYCAPGEFGLVHRPLSDVITAYRV